MCCYAVQVQTALGAIVRDSAARELPCGVFGSFGWSGEAVDELENRLKVTYYLCTCMKLTWIKGLVVDELENRFNVTHHFCTCMKSTWVELGGYRRARNRLKVKYCLPVCLQYVDSTASAL